MQKRRLRFYWLNLLLNLFVFCLFFVYVGLGMGIPEKNGWKNIFGSEWNMPDRAVLLVIVCVYEQKNIFYKITWHQQELA